MKLLLGVISIATVGTLATGLKREEIDCFNYSFDYWLKIDGEYKSGYFEFRGPPQYVSYTDWSSITVFFHPTTLLNGVGVNDADPKKTIIESGEARNFGPGIQEINEDTFQYILRPQPNSPVVDFVPCTYLLGTPESVKLQVRDEVEVCLTQSTMGESDLYVKGIVVHVDGKTYVQISKESLENYANIVITTTMGIKIYDYQHSYGIKGPFVALPIVAEED